MRKKHKEIRSKTVALGLLLGACLFLILLFYVGMGESTSLKIAQNAITVSSLIRESLFAGRDSQSLANIQDALVNLRSSEGLIGLFRATPFAVLYLVGGANDFTSLLFPVSATLINVILVFLLAQRLYGRSAGYIASFLYIALPLTLFTASALLYTQIIVTLFLCLLILSIRVIAEPKKKSLLVCLLMIGMALLILDAFVAICAILLIATITTLAKKKTSLVWIPTGISLAVLFLFSNGNPGEPYIVFYEGVLQLSEMAIFLPMGIIIFSFVMKGAHTKDRLPVLLVAFSFIALLLRLSLFPESNLVADPLLTLLMIGTILALDNFLSREFEHPHVRQAVSLSCLVLMLIAWLAVQGQTMLISPLSGYGLHSLIPALEILPGIVFIVFVVFSIGLARKRQIKLVWLPVSLLLFSSSLIPSAWDRTNLYRSPFNAARMADELLVDAEMDLPVFVLDDPRLVSHIQYIESSKPSTQLSVRSLTFDEATGIDNGYLLYWEDRLKQPPHNWWQIDSFGILGKPRLVVVRILSQEEANKVYANASLRVTEQPSSQNDQNLYGSALNAKLYCAGFIAWIASQYSVGAAPDFIPLYDFPVMDCFDLSEGVNLLESQTPVIYPGFGTFQGYEGSPNLQEGVGFRNKYPFFEDPRTFYFETMLKPNSIYLYHVAVNATETVMPLYWNIEGKENYLDNDVYPDWTSLTVLFSTFDTHSDPVVVTISPLLFYVSDYGAIVYLKDLQLFEITAEMLIEGPES